MITDPLVYAVAVISVIALGLSKGGFSGVGTIAAPLLSLVVPPLQALGILLPILLVQDVVTIWAYRRTWDAWNLSVLIPGQIIGVGVAWLLAFYVSDAYVRLAIGVIAIAFVLNHWFGRRPAEQPGRPPVIKGMFWGGLAGLTSFLANAAAPPFQIFVLPQRLAKEVFVGTLTIFLAFGNALKVIPYYTLGGLDWGNLATSAVLFPLAIAANMAGVWLVRRTPTELFYKVLYVLIFLVGCEQIRIGLTGILTR